ncbi:MAG: MBL fold metallo-hydrolase [Limnochordia bacterium]
MGIQLHFLGTSSGLPTKTRRNQTIVLEIDTAEAKQHYLIDPADGASSFLAADLGHEHLAGVFISHMHVDHFSGVFQVIKTAWHLGRTEPLPIYLPEEGIPLIRSVLEHAKYGSSRSLKTVNADHRIRFMPITKYGSSRSPTTA